MEHDPGRYNNWARAFTKIQRAQAQVTQLEQQAKDADAVAQQERAAEKQQRLTDTRSELGRLIPDLLDKDKGPKLSADITQYAAQNKISPERAGGYSANEVVLLHKAMQFDAMKAAEAANLEAATKKAAKAPPVQEPGTRKTADAKAERAEANWEQFNKSGRVDHAASVFRDIFSA